MIGELIKVQIIWLEVRAYLKPIIKGFGNKGGNPFLSSHSPNLGTITKQKSSHFHTPQGTISLVEIVRVR